MIFAARLRSQKPKDTHAFLGTLRDEMDIAGWSSSSAGVLATDLHEAVLTKEDVKSRKSAPGLNQVKAISQFASNARLTAPNGVRITDEVLMACWLSNIPHLRVANGEFSYAPERNPLSAIRILKELNAPEEVITLVVQCFTDTNGVAGQLGAHSGYCQDALLVQYFYALVDPLGNERDPKSFFDNSPKLPRFEVDPETGAEFVTQARGWLGLPQDTARSLLDR